jgi:hypothetical protein
MPLQLSGTSGVLDNSGAFIASTAVASTSGTSIDFTSIPSWVKRVTVMFNGVSTNGGSQRLIQLGAGSITTTGYASTGTNLQNASSVSLVSSTAGMLIQDNSAGTALGGAMIISNLSGNIWVASGNFATTTGASIAYTSGGFVTLAGTLDRVRITTVNGTDAFDAGSINIAYE